VIVPAPHIEIPAEVAAGIVTFRLSTTAAPSNFLPALARVLISLDRAEREAAAEPQAQQHGGPTP
jgi:hypothetical protein